MGKSDADSGNKPGRKRRVSDDDIVHVLREADTPVLTTGGVADRLPIKRRAALKRLKGLYGEGRVGSMDVAKAKVWWPTDDNAVGTGENDGRP